MTQSNAPQIEVRRMNFEFPKQIDRYWFGNSPFKTHLLNSLTLFLPDFEQYMIRNVGRQLKQINNPQLKQEVRAFVSQEGQHSSQHAKFWINLRLQGYEIDTYIRFVKAIFLNTLERRLSTNLNLAIIAGFEHLTTLFADFALEEDYLAEAEPKLRKLFEWHGAEEIEHKLVAYDVLQNATNNYPLRLVGMLISHILILGLLNLGLAVLLYQDKKLLDRKVWQEMSQFWFIKEKLLFRALRNSLDYSRKNFHPSQRNNLFLIKKVIG
jgi:predicted metal-dependent hydrolase